jgi:hypothetical protein
VSDVRNDAESAGDLSSAVIAAMTCIISRLQEETVQTAYAAGH